MTAIATDKQTVETHKVVEGQTVEEAAESNRKKQQLKIAAVLVGTVAFHVGCAFVIHKLNKSAASAITVE